MIEKNSYLYYFEPKAKEALKNLENEEGFSLLSEGAKEQLTNTILLRINRVTSSYFQYLLAEQLKDENPLAGFDFKMITKEERERYMPLILEKLKSGELSLPSRMEETIGKILSNFVSFSKGMLSHLLRFRREICDLLFDGRQYRMITGIIASGDTHNHGKSTSIIETDAGKFVYKPHSCRIDVSAFGFMRRYFDDIIVMPKAFAYGDEFGAVEFLEKKTAEGREEAKKYYYALGGTAAVIKMLGATDMHCENLFACSGRLALIDIETLLYPFADSEKNILRILYGTENAVEMNQSIMYTALLNGRIEMPGFEKEFSILINTDEDGSAPLVEGSRRSVLEFKEEFFSGFSDIYDRCIAQREALLADVKEEFSGKVMRSIVWATRSYGEVLQRLHSFYSYNSEDYYASQLEKLPEVLTRAKAKVHPKIEKQEIRALMENEIPFFYTYGESKDLYSGKEMVVQDYYEQSAIERALVIIRSMSEKEKQFEMQYMKLSIGLSKIKAKEIPKAAKPSEIPLAPARALKEAEQIMAAIYRDSIVFTSGDLSWMMFEPGRENPEIMDYGLYSGLSGMSVFYAAMAHASSDERIREAAGKCLESCLRLLLGFLASEELAELEHDAFRFRMGEGSGIAGLLRALVIINQIDPGRCDVHISRAKQLLSGLDVSLFEETDKSSGIAGLLATLCRYETFWSDPDMRMLIRALAEKLISLKTLNAGNRTVWKTLRDKNHPISGAVHGMTGIAEALYLAGLRLETNDFTEAAKDAIAFEDESYNEKDEDWMDLRVPGNHIIAKGNCYGTEGIGIVCNRLKAAGIKADEFGRMTERAEKAVRRHTLIPLDHLCCGKMSTVDYYLETGDRDSAGKILDAVVKQKEELGSYRLGYADHLTNNNVTLFYGLAGIGYELIRYTDPDRYPTVL